MKTTKELTDSIKSRIWTALQTPALGDAHELSEILLTLTRVSDLESNLPPDVSSDTKPDFGPGLGYERG